MGLERKPRPDVPQEDPLVCTPVFGGFLLAPLPGRQVDTGGSWGPLRPLTQAGWSLTLGEQGAARLPARKPRPELTSRPPSVQRWRAPSHAGRSGVRRESLHWGPCRPSLRITQRHEAGRFRCSWVVLQADWLLVGRGLVSGRNPGTKAATGSVRARGGKLGWSGICESRS